jgi:hypothetical protein
VNSIHYSPIFYVNRSSHILEHKVCLSILCVEHCGKIYLHTILRNTVCWTLGRFIYTKYWGTLYVEHCRKTYLHKILGITSCWTLGIFIYIKYLEILCWALSDYLFTQNTGDYSMLNTVGRFIYTKYWEILYAEYCGNIYLHKILGITLCWTCAQHTVFLSILSI